MGMNEATIIHLENCEYGLVDKRVRKNIFSLASGKLQLSFVFTLLLGIMHINNTPIMNI